MTVAEYQALLPSISKRGKYGNKKTDGFDSKKEAKRYGELMLEQRAGLITDLNTQVSFKFVHDDQLLMTYKADFTYTRDGVFIVEDVKGGEGTKTAVYRLKRKAMLIWYGITIFET